jgi:hypothetical protein
MRRLLLPLAAIAIAGLLLPAGVRPAYACTCAPLPTDDDGVKELMGYFDALVIGTIEKPGSNETHPGKVQVAVESLFKGPPVASLSLDQSSGLNTEHESLGPDCSLLIAEKPNRKYFLALRAELDGTYSPSGCSTFPMEWLDAPRREDIAAFLVTLETLTGVSAFPPTGSTPPTEQPGGDTPWLPIIIGSSLAAALAASTLLLRRR